MKKKTAAVLAVFGGILAAGMGVTMGYMTDQGSVSNQILFAGKDGIQAVLTEPSWDPEKGLDVLPGQVLPKDPQVTNTSDIDMDLLVALEVQFVCSESCPQKERAGQPLTSEEMQHVCDVYQIDWNADQENSGQWVRFDGETAGDQTQHFYYRPVLERNYPEEGDVTVPLFTNVTVPSDVTNEQYAYVQAIGGVEIRLSGMVIQQMSGEHEFGIHSAEEAYKAGLFTFTLGEE